MDRADEIVSFSLHAATIRRDEREFIAPSPHRVLKVRVREPAEAPDA